MCYVMKIRFVVTFAVLGFLLYTYRYVNLTRCLRVLHDTTASQLAPDLLAHLHNRALVRLMFMEPHGQHIIYQYHRGASLRRLEEIHGGSPSAI